MREILDDLDRWQQSGEDIALATLVCVRGSAPRLPGARFCVTRTGTMAGSVSGGCVENDVFERALGVLERRRPEIATYGIADDLAFEVGLSCGGSIDVLIEPFAPTAGWLAAREAVESQRPAALATGLSPASLLGRKLAVVGSLGTSSSATAAGCARDNSATTLVGAIDPALDQQVVAEARRLLLSGGTGVLALPHRGADATVFVEAFPPPLRLFIVGATHTASALCRMATGLGFRVSVVDARGLYATRERFPEADELLVASPAEVLATAGLDAYAYVAILTHDPKFDVPAAERALRSGARYVGMVGSRRTQEERADRLRERGLTDADLTRLRGPIGLDIGSRTPEEIALAICAELLAVRSGRGGGALSEQRGAIRDRA